MSNINHELQELLDVEGKVVPDSDFNLTQRVRPDVDRWIEPVVHGTEIDVPGAPDDTHVFTLKEFVEFAPDRPVQAAIEVVAPEQGDAHLRIAATGPFETDAKLLKTAIAVGLQDSGVVGRAILEVEEQSSNLSPAFLESAGGTVIDAATSEDGGIVLAFQASTFKAREHAIAA